MSDHDLQVDTEDGTAIVTITPLAGADADAVADDIAAVLTEEYGEDVRET